MAYLTSRKVDEAEGKIALRYPKHELFPMLYFKIKGTKGQLHVESEQLSTWQMSSVISCSPDTPNAKGIHFDNTHNGHGLRCLLWLH